MNEPQVQNGRPAEPARKGSAKARAMTRAALRHALPFILWICAMLAGSVFHLTPSAESHDIKSLNLISDAGLYAVQVALAVVALAVLRPWVYHAGCFKSRNILPALAIGIGVFAIWVLPQTDLLKSLSSGIWEFYEKWCVLPFGEIRDFAPPKGGWPYAPASCGIPLTIVRLLGSGLVIAIAEEFFWRAYLLRAARTPDFLDIDSGVLHLPSFLCVTAVFAAEHAEWAAGAIAGLAYGLLFVRTRDIWSACCAHAVTNLLLGAYVISTGHWEFW